MVAIGKSSFAIATLFASLSAAWSVGIYQTQNSCGGKGAADTTRTGEAGVTSACKAHGFVEIKAMNVSDWDDGCKVDIYQGVCSTFITDFKKEDQDVVDNNWSCMNGLQSVKGIENFESFIYNCDG